MAQRVVITRDLPGDPAGRLRAASGLEIDELFQHPEDRALPRARLLDAVQGATAVITTPADQVDAEFLDAAGPQLRIVSNFAVGVDNIDLAEARRRAILVGHTPDAVTEPTADIAWLLLLGAARRATKAIETVRSGQWAGLGVQELLGTRLVGKKILIVGAGRIGLAVARRALGWRMEVLYVARSRHPEFHASPIDGRRVDLLAGLTEADVVSVHTPLTPETRHLIGERELAAMRPDAILVNTSRGAVLDENALVRALRGRKLLAAGLDVYEREPRLADGLAELENAFLLPHIGSATFDDRVWMMEIAVDNAIAAMRGEMPPHVIR
jgi:glyoxylate reductase